MSNQAEFLFWHVPQLLNNLVEFLDIASLLEVSLVVPLAADLGGGTVIFKRLLTRLQSDHCQGIFVMTPASKPRRILWNSSPGSSL